MMIRRAAAVAAMAGALALAPATAYAGDDAPEAGGECTPADARAGVVDLDDGTVLECVKTGRHKWAWVDVTEVDGEDDGSEDEGDEESDEEGQEEEEGGGDEQGSEDEGSEEDGGESTEDGSEDEGQEDGGGEADAPDCVDVNTADAETLRMLRHVDEDRAGQILELRPFSSADDLDRVSGLKAGGPRLAELIAGGGEWLPLCDIDAPDDEQQDGDADDKPAPAEQADAAGSLPVTGAALAALVATGVVALGGGGAAAWMARRRK